ncbi:MAG: hypothetical protein ACM3SU_15885 [Acidobacteriota bacterium]
MIVLEDFTKLAVGARVPTDGRVAVCPRCGRNGARRRRLDGAIRYVHVQTSQVFGDGLRAEPVDSCTIAESPDEGRTTAVTAVPAPPPASRRARES